MEKYKAYFKNGNIDIEHTILIIYSLCWGAPFIINKLGYIWLLYISRAYHSVLLLFFVSLVLLVINGYILYIVIRKFLKAIRQRKIAFILIIFYLFIPFLQATVFWLGFTFLTVTILFNNLSPSYEGIRTILVYLEKYSQLYSKMVNSFEMVARSGAFIPGFIAFSMMLNIVVPQKYQKVDLSWKDKVMRFLWKVAGLLIPITILFIFSAINKSTFTVVGTVVAVLTWFVNPVHRASLFIRDLKISEDDFKPRIINNSKMLQLILGLVVTSMGISVYFFEKQNWLARFFISASIFFILIVIILIYQFIVNRKKTEWITKNFKKEVAIELIELDNIKQDE